MKNSVKFAGIAAATLLAVAPVATTTVSAATANTTAASNDYTDKKFTTKSVTRVTNSKNYDPAQVYNYSSTKKAMVPVAGKKFAQESLWVTDKSRTLADGSVYYRVSTNEWLKSDTASKPLSPYDESGMKSMNATLTTQKAYYEIFSSFNSSRIKVGELPHGGSYKVSAKATNENGQTMYRVGKNQWITPGFGATIK